jgi:nucleotide-binding universal stress UspA family protein
MMRTILVPLAQGLAGEPALQAALAVAKRMNSHIRAMFVRPEPETLMSYLPILPMVGAAAGVTRDAVEKEGQQAAEAARVSFDAWRSRQKLPEAPVEGSATSARCFGSGINAV